MRLGIDLDGVIADFNAGWIRIHRDEFGSDLRPEMVTTWDGLHELAGFEDAPAFWRWARATEVRPTIFRHLDPYPDALPALARLTAAGDEIVIVTTKPKWARPDTFRWLADHEIPTGEVHILREKHRVACDVYLDDSPHVLPRLVRHRPDALVCRFVRPWNETLEGTVDVASWAEFEAAVAARRTPSVRPRRS